MSALTSESESRLARRPEEEWQRRYDLTERERGGGLSPGLMLAGLAAVGLGVLAWYYLGPDLVRYMKIRNM
jgi:hypothetical protein